MRSLRVNSVLLATIVLWASAFVGIRIALAGYSPGPLALLRFIIASLCMAIIYYRQDIKVRMPWHHRVQLIVAGMAGIGIYNICLNYGEITVSAGISSFIIGLMPVMTVLLSLVFFRERLSSGVWVGILISLSGLLILAVGEGVQANILQGVLLLVISALMGAILTIVQKKLLDLYHPVAIMFWIMWGGTLLLMFFFPQLLLELRNSDYLSTGAVIYLGIFPAALAYLAWSYVLRELSASKASISLYALPVVSTLLGYILLHEQPSLLSLTGGAVALIGALFAHHFQQWDSFNKKLVAA